MHYFQLILVSFLPANISHALVRPFSNSAIGVVSGGGVDVMGFGGGIGARGAIKCKAEKYDFQIFIEK